MRASIFLLYVYIQTCVRCTRYNTEAYTSALHILWICARGCRVLNYAYFCGIILSFYDFFFFIEYLLFARQTREELFSQSIIFAKYNTAYLREDVFKSSFSSDTTRLSGSNIQEI